LGGWVVGKHVSGMFKGLNWFQFRPLMFALLYFLVMWS